MKVLVAFDESDGAEAALQVAARLVREAGGRVLLLHVLNPSSDAADVFAASQREALEIVVKRERDALAARAAALEPVEAEVRCELLERGEDAWHGILRVAGEWSADFIAIASRRAAGLGGALAG